MSWLFGIKKEPIVLNTEQFANQPDGSNQATPGNQQENQGSGASEAYRFDSLAAERAAQAELQNQDQLARKRFEDQLIQLQRANEDNLRKQEESVAKQEAMKKQALVLEMELRVVEAKAARDIEDLYLERTYLKAAENGTTAAVAIKTVGAEVDSRLNALTSDWGNFLTAVAVFSLFSFSFYAGKDTTKVVARYVKWRFSKPSLGRETSRFTF